MLDQKTGFVCLIVIAAILLVGGCTQPSASGAAGIPPATPQAQAGGSAQQVLLETTMGNITIALSPDMPITTGHFIALVKNGTYNGVIFHRVIDGFMIQGGDPTGTGMGGSGPGGASVPIPDEFTTHNHNDRGTVAMANAGPNTGDSQFFINLVDNNYLDTKHPVFGRVTDGMAVVDAIGKVPTSGQPYNRPLTNVTIIRAEVV